ncbi:MAG: uL15 family ribosomal protein, partial [Clostridia bacterium]|nr:uL15 family ribosomal protein [Clostridia bacterium]
IFAKEYSIVNVKDLERFEDGTVVNAELLLKTGILSKVENYGVKVLGDGTLTKKLTVQANKFTKSAAEIITKAGGEAEVL